MGVMAMKKMAWEIPLFPIEEKMRRHKAIRELMAFRKIGCLVIPGTHSNYGAGRANIRYVSNYAQWYDDEYITFPLEGEPLLFAWSSAHYDWATRVSWIPVKLSSERDYIKDIADEIKRLGLETKTIGIVDMRIMPAFTYIGLIKELPHTTFVDATDILLTLRLVKSPKELEFVRKAGEIADIGFKAMLEAAEVGASDRNVWTACESALIRAGAEPPSFTLYCSGPWPEKGVGFIYGPMDRRLQKGDIVFNEITPCYGGYWIQLCRAIVLGEPSDDFKRTYDVQVEVYKLAEEELRKGNTVFELEKKAQDLAAKKGYHLKITLQHMGLQITERIPANTIFRPGMYFVNHPWTEYPMDTREVGGHIIGDTLIVTDNVPEHLSKIPFQLFRK
jgi:Xaa-Pro dipeptidase